MDLRGGYEKMTTPDVPGESIWLRSDGRQGPFCHPRNPQSGECDEVHGLQCLDLHIGRARQANLQRDGGCAVRAHRARTAGALRAHNVRTWSGFRGLGSAGTRI